MSTVTWLGGVAVVADVAGDDGVGAFLLLRFLVFSFSFSLVSCVGGSSFFYGWDELTSSGKSRQWKSAAVYTAPIELQRGVDTENETNLIALIGLVCWIHQQIIIHYQHIIIRVISLTYLMTFVDLKHQNFDNFWLFHAKNCNTIWWIINID